MSSRTTEFGLKTLPLLALLLVSQDAMAKRFAVPFAGRWTAHNDVKKLRNNSALSFGPKGHSAESLYTTGIVNFKKSNTEGKLMSGVGVVFALLAGKESIAAAASNGDPFAIGTAILFSLAGASPYISDWGGSRASGDVNVIHGVLQNPDVGKRNTMLREMKLETRKFARKKFAKSLKETQSRIKRVGNDSKSIQKERLNQKVTDLKTAISRLDSFESL